MKALSLNQYGEPGNVLNLIDKPEPKPGAGEVVVRMLLSPVNPSDLLFIRGKYGNQPSLPQIPGFEGVGVVEAGNGLLAWRVMNKRVSVIGAGDGRWQEKVVIPARQAVPVPSSLTDQQAASFFVNPATAWVMTQKILKVKPGEWLLQSASTGFLGKMIVQLGKHLGFKTINLVRKESQVDLMKKEGADEVVCISSGGFREKVLKITQGKGVVHALDAVGGAVGSEMIHCLGSNGKLLVYGRMSGDPLSFEPGDIMKGQKTIQGFWLSEWAKAQGPLTMLALFSRIGKLIKMGVLGATVGKEFPLSGYQAALEAAAVAENNCKVYLKIGK